jgi:cytosine deaminase
MQVISQKEVVTDKVLKLIAYLPTRSLLELIEADFFKKLKDRDFIRIAFYLAQKSYQEGGCPIGALVVENKTNLIIGKGHNVLVQNNDPYGHGEVSAIKEAGRLDFSQTTIFTSLSPCDVCAALIRARQFNRLVVGDITNASDNEELLRQSGIAVDILEDPEAISLYRQYRAQKPELDIEDWKGLAEVNKK